MELTFLYNAGVCLRAGRLTILADALEDGFTPYEGASWELLSLPADALLFTHKHPDHFSPRMTFAYLQEHPFCHVYGGPEIIEALLALRVEAQRLHRLCAYTSVSIGGDLILTALPTRHMGAEYMHKEHFSLFLRNKAATLLITGDAAPIHNNFERGGVPLGHVDLMIAPYVYAMYEPAQRLFSRAVQTERLALNHIPEPDTGKIRDGLYAIPPSARAYEMIVTEKNTQVEVDRSW